MSYFSLDRAFLCADCRAVHSSSTQCPACANRCGLMNLATVLDRHTLSQEAKEVLSFIPSFREAVSA